MIGIACFQSCLLSVQRQLKLPQGFTRHGICFQCIYYVTTTAWAPPARGWEAAAIWEKYLFIFHQVDRHVTVLQGGVLPRFRLLL